MSPLFYSVMLMMSNGLCVPSYAFSADNFFPCLPPLLFVEMLAESKWSLK